MEKIEVIEAEKVKDLIGKVTFIDVRKPGEFA